MNIKEEEVSLLSNKIKEIKEAKNKNQIKINLKKINLVLVVLVIFCSIAYLVGSNELSTRGFSLKEAKDSLALIKEENKKLENELAGLSSTNNLKNRIATLNMVLANDFNYISSTNLAMAKK